MKKVPFIVVSAFLILAQVCFIVVMLGSETLVDFCAGFGLDLPDMMRDGLMRNFLAVYAILRIDLTAYAQFMFDVSAWWWLLPLACALLSAWASWRGSARCTLFVLFANIGVLYALIMVFFSIVDRLGEAASSFERDGAAIFGGMAPFV